MSKKMKEGENEKQKKWFQSLLTTSSEEENFEDDSASINCLSNHVKNTTLRFPYPMLSDDSDEESGSFCALNIQETTHAVKKSRKKRVIYSSSEDSTFPSNKPKKSKCKNNKGYVNNSEVGKHKSIPPNSKNLKSQVSKPRVRNKTKIIWNYTKRRKKRHVYYSPAIILSTSEDERGIPARKDIKRERGRRPSQLKSSSSEDSLCENKNVLEPQNEVKNGSYNHSKFLSSSSNSEHSDFGANENPKLIKKKLYNPIHDLSTSPNSSDSESCSNPIISKETTSSGYIIPIVDDNKRAAHYISPSSEEEVKHDLSLKSNQKLNKTKHYSSSSAVKFLPNKHPFRNLITAQQLQEDNRKMKQGLNRTLHQIDSSAQEGIPVKDTSQFTKTVDSAAWKKIADIPVRTNGSTKSQSSHASKLQNLKKKFISSNQSSVELSKQIQSNMNSSKTDKYVSKKSATIHNIKTPLLLEMPLNKVISSKSNDEVKSCILSNDCQKTRPRERESRYVNVYCNSNQSEGSNLIQHSEVQYSNDVIDKTLSQNVGINLTAVQDNEKTNAMSFTNKRNIRSHDDQSVLNKHESKSHVLCESNSESKLNKHNTLNRIDNSDFTPNETKPDQFDVLGDILSQMKNNPYPCQKSRRKSLEQGSDTLGWFPSNPAFSSTPPVTLNNVSVINNKETAQYPINSASVGSKHLLITDPMHNPQYNPLQYSQLQQDNSSKKSLQTDGSHNGISSSSFSKSVETGIARSSVQVHQQSNNEVIIPFYSANHDDYVKMLKKPVGNVDRIKLGSEENLGNCQSSKSYISSVQSDLLSKANVRNVPETPFPLMHLSNRAFKQASDSLGINDTPKENVTQSKFENGPTNTNSNNTNKSISQLEKNVRKCSINEDKLKNNSITQTCQNKNDSLRQVDPINNKNKSHNAEDKTAKENQQIGSLKVINMLDSTQSTSKKGVRVRIQGSEFRYQMLPSRQTKDACQDSKLEIIDKDLTSEKIVSQTSNATTLINECDSFQSNQEETSLAKENNNLDSENLSFESVVVTSNNSNKSIPYSDSDNDASSSDDSSSTYASDDSICKTTGGSSSDSSSSTCNSLEQREVKESINETSSCATKEPTTADIEVIILGSSSDEEIDTTNNALFNVTDHLNSSSCLSENSKKDNVDSNPSNSAQSKSIFDPVENCEEEVLHNFHELGSLNVSTPTKSKNDNVEFDLLSSDDNIHLTSRPVFDPGTNVQPEVLHNFEHEPPNTTKPPDISSSSNCSLISQPCSSNNVVGKIRVRCLKELGVHSEMLQLENALKPNSIQNSDMSHMINLANEADLVTKKPNRTVQLQPDILQKSNFTAETRVNPNNRILLNSNPSVASAVKAPLKIKLSKVSQELKKTVYKIQSTIPLSRKASNSQHNIPTTKIPDRVSSIQKRQTIKDSVSEPTRQQNTPTTDVLTDSTQRKLHCPARKMPNSNHSLLCVKTGGNAFKLVQNSSNQSNSNNCKTDKQPKALSGKVFDVSQSFNIQNSAPNSVAIPSNPVFFVPIAPMVCQPKHPELPATVMQPPLTTSAEVISNCSALPLDSQHSPDSFRINAVDESQENLPVLSTKATEKITCSKQVCDAHQPPQTIITSVNPTAQDTLEADFFKLCDELFNEVVCLKIPKMVDDLHLAIVYDAMKEERLKKTDQLLSTETILSEKSRAERDFNEQLRIRGHSFVPLFSTVVNKINKSNLKTLIIALYIRFISQLERIDPKNASYRLRLRHIIKAMLQKSGSATNDLCKIFSDSDLSFTQNYIFVERLLIKYDSHVEQRRAQKQITVANTSIDLTGTNANKKIKQTNVNCSSVADTNKRKVEEQEQSRGNANQERNNSTSNQTPGCSTLLTSDYETPQDTASTSSKNFVESPINNQTELTKSNNSIPIQQEPIINLDDLMFQSFFKKNN